MLYNFRHWSFFRWFLPAFSLLVGGPLQAVPPVGSGILTPQDLNPVIKRGEGPLCWRPHLMSLAPARWIWLPSQRTLPNTFVLFRREVTLEAAPQDAPAWITADSRYRLTVNGRRVLWGPAPCDPRQMDVDPVNLAPYLRQGRNVIGVEVLHYGIGEGTWPAGKPGLLFQAQVAMDGGRQVSIVSDASWKCLLDRAHPPGQFKRWFLRTLQEEFDARLHPLGWDTVEFQPDSGWLPAMVLDCPADKPSSCSNYPGNDGVDRTDPTHAALRARQIPALREQDVPALRLAASGRVEWLRDPRDWFECRIPGSFRIRTDPVARNLPETRWQLPAVEAKQGVYATFEFQEQIVGWPHLTIDAPEGTIVELMWQEVHDPAGPPWLDTHFFSWARFICREGLNRFETFDYESLRGCKFTCATPSAPWCSATWACGGGCFPGGTPPISTAAIRNCRNSSTRPSTH